MNPSTSDPFAQLARSTNSDRSFDSDRRPTQITVKLAIRSLSSTACKSQVAELFGLGVNVTGLPSGQEQDEVGGLSSAISSLASSREL
jgi:hypothetical protein